MRRRRMLLLASGLVLAPSICLAQGQPQKSPADSMRELRLMMLTTPPEVLSRSV